jgi:excisionase family DNA binding protein
MTQTDPTIKQAAELFGCSGQTVQAWIKAGR